MLFIRRKYKHFMQRFKLNIEVMDDNFCQLNEPMGESIPKVVYQTAPQAYLNEPIMSNIERLKKQNPEWEFRLYSDEDQVNFIHEHFPQVLRYYDAIDSSYGAAKADLFRYLLIYKYGGVYLDIKSSTSKPLNQIVGGDDKFILTHWEDGSNGYHPEIGSDEGEFQQWHVISVSGHPFLKAVINNVCRNIKKYHPFLHGKGAYATLRVTGPVAYTLAILPIAKHWPHKIRTDSQLGLVYSIFSNNMKDYLVHRKFMKSHYAAAVKPMIRQPYLVELIYTQTWRVFWKIQKILNIKNY